MMKKRMAPYVVFVALALLFIHCGGGIDIPQSTAAEALSRGVRVGLQFTQPTVEGYLDFLSPTVRAEAEAQGFTFRSTEVVYPTIPAVGYYLKIGNTFIPSGPNGEFYIPKDMNVPASVPLFKQLTDTVPIGTVDIAGALRPASSPLQMVVLPLRGRVLGSAAEMDGTPPSRAARQTDQSSCCTKSTSASRAISDGCRRVDCNVTTNDPRTGCCFDFDLSKGRIIGEEQGEDDGDEGRRRGRVDGFCAAKRVAEFYGTECYKWTVGSGGYSAACINERAILQVTGPSCWANHKYRFCQNMSMTDFSVSTTGTVQVQVGSTLSITVHNNTPANETMVQLTGDAAGNIQSGPGIQPMTGTFRIEHYDDAAQQHINDRTIVYEAPASLPNGQTEASNTLTFSANGITKTLTIRVVQKCEDTRGGVPCYR